MENVNGLLIDETGVIRGIEVPISQEPATNFLRVARHEGLTIGANMQMVQRIRVVKQNGLGVELSSALLEMEINPNVRSQLMNAYQDTVYAANTEGAFVNASGKANPQPDEESIEQLAFFQGITIGALKAKGVTINNTTSVASLVYLLILGEIQKLDAQGRL